MKNLFLILGLLFSTQIFAADLVCNDQNSHSVYQLETTDGLSSIRLVSILNDSSILSAGTKSLRKEEGESSPEVTTYAGKTNAGLSLVVMLNSEKASSLRESEILDVTIYFQTQKNGILSGRTTLLCSLK